MAKQILVIALCAVSFQCAHLLAPLLCLGWIHCAQWCVEIWYPWQPKYHQSQSKHYGDQLNLHLYSDFRREIPNRLYSCVRLQTSSIQPKRKYCPHEHFSNIILLPEMFSFLMRQRELHMYHRLQLAEIGRTLNEGIKAFAVNYRTFRVSQPWNGIQALPQQLVYLNQVTQLH